MLHVGLTGGIGCGKSTVAAMFRVAGIPVLDADPLAKEMILPGGAAYDEVIREFGASVLNADGRIEHAKLAAIVFADAAKLARLNAIVHPHVRRAIERQFDEWSREGKFSVAIVEAALLIEAGYEQLLDRMIVVWCSPEQQRERLLARGMTGEQIAARIASQMPLDEKRRHATDQIDNSGSVEQTRTEVRRLIERLRSLAADGKSAS